MSRYLPLSACLHQPAAAPRCPPSLRPPPPPLPLPAASQAALALTPVVLPDDSWLAFGRVCYDNEFMQVYLILTLIIALLVFGLGEKKAGEKSAYSVFNKGMGSIAGTFGAQDVDNALRSKEKEAKDFTEVFTSDEDEDPHAVGTLKTLGKRKKAIRKRETGQLHTGGHVLGGGS